MGFFSKLLNSPALQVRTDGVYVWNYKGLTKNGIYLKLSYVLLFDGQSSFVFEYDKLFYPNKSEIKSLLNVAKNNNYENCKVDKCEFALDRNKIEIVVLKSITEKIVFRGFIYEKNLVLDIFKVIFDEYNTYEREWSMKCTFDFFSI